MRVNLPPLFFRVKDNGALVYRVETKGKFGRIEFTHIANVVSKANKIKLSSDEIATEDEIAQMKEWMYWEETNQLSELATGLRRISREVNLVCNSLSTVTEMDKNLEQAANQLLLSLLDIQRELTEKIARNNRKLNNA